MLSFKLTANVSFINKCAFTHPMGMHKNTFVFLYIYSGAFIICNQNPSTNLANFSIALPLSFLFDQVKLTKNSNHI